jgi:hypothetical protein
MRLRKPYRRLDRAELGFGLDRDLLGGSCCYLGGDGSLFGMFGCSRGSCRFRLARGALAGRLLRLDLTPQAVAVGLATDAVSLRVLDRRRVALDPDAQREAQVERFLVRETELACKLINPDLLGQLLTDPLCTPGACPRTVQNRVRRGRISSHTDQRPVFDPY